MNFISSILHRALSFLDRWWHPPYRTIIAQEVLPTTLNAKTIYIVEEDGFEEQAAMLCPCGCRRILHLNLLPDERPCWHLTHHRDRTVTLHPSIWRKKDCGSHFWFRRGKVQWCESQGTENNYEKIQKANELGNGRARNSQHWTNA